MTSRRTLVARITRALILWVSAVWLVCMAGVVFFVDDRINRYFDKHQVAVSQRLPAADPLTGRSELLRSITMGLLISMAAMLALLALLLHTMVRRELSAFDALDEQIGRRDGRDLSPIVLDSLPTEMARVATSINQLLLRLAQALDLERALAADAAHELRTPLAALRIQLETALEYGPEQADLRKAIDAVARLTHLTEKLLQLSRVEANAGPYGPVDLIELAAAVIDEFRDAARASVVLVMTGGPFQEVRGDIDSLGIAMRNLLDNAARHGGGQITVEVAAPAVLMVRDQGPGVDPARVDQLSQRHIRESALRDGYGLGLALVNRIAEQHRARLEFHSPPPGQPHGLEVRMVFPPADYG